MKNYRKQFFLDNINSSNQIRKIEFDLSNKFKNGNFKINKNTNIVTIEYKDEHNIEKDTKIFVEIVKNVSKEIDIVEREIKPSYRKVLILENLDCAICASKIERIAKRSFDYEFIVVDFASTRFIIESTDLNLIENLESKVQEIASSVDAGINVIKKTEQSQKSKKTFKIDKTRKINFIIGVLIFAIGFLIKTILKNHTEVNQYIILGIVYTTYVIGYVLLAGDVLYGAFKNIKSGRIFDEKFLMSLATITALFVGYYDEAVFVMLFYKVGELLQQYAVNYSRKSIASLMDIQPQVANLIVNGEIVEIDPMEVVVGDIIYIRPDDRIPLDGVIIEGEGQVDTSALTGESLYRDVKKGDEILSGSINIDGSLKVKVTKVYQESMVSKVLNLVENASSLKSSSENFISKFAKYYTPAVVIIAVVLAIFLPFIIPAYDISWENGFKESIMIALVFLVISCPCALVISIPLGFFGGIGGSSKQGILIKGSNYLEALNSVDTFVFDKTGTLTEGKFEVSEIISFGNYHLNDILQYAAYCEVNSNHLIARSIVDAYGLENIHIERINAKKQTSGFGVNNIVDGMDIFVGKIEYITKNGINSPIVDKIGTKIYVAINGNCEGCLIIKDKLKDNAINAIKQLKINGVKKTIMLTGDSELVALEVSKALGIDAFFANMSPIDKVEKLLETKSKMEQGKKIAYVGDGINDAPVLSSADIGIAMGGLGSDIAIQAADIVLMTDDISKLPIALKIARKTRKIVIQNIILALGVKFAVLSLALLGPFLINTGLSFLMVFLIYEAIFADVGVSLIAILNSLRAMRIKK